MFAIMEKTKLVVYHNTEAEPPIQISGYIARLSDLEITVIQLDEIMRHSEHPKSDMLSTIPCEVREPQQPIKS